jgi:glyoxylase-like metal-dependent hydrolase (beta-lactamase superfamily II)
MEAARVVPIPLTIMGPRGVNAFLVIGARPTIVDSGIPGSAPQILDALARESIDPGDVALLIITHAHVDHAGDAWAIKEATGARVVAHESDALALRSGTSSPVLGRTPEAQRMLDAMALRTGGQQPRFKGVEPGVLVDEEYSLAEYGIAGRLLHTPGHTDGGLTLFLDDGQAIVGDILGGAVDDPEAAAPSMFAVDPDAMLRSVRRVLALDPTLVYCGHGGPFERTALRRLAASL